MTAISKRLTALIGSDVKNISRDYIMLLGFFAPVLIGIVFKFAVPPITTLLKTELNFDLTPFYTLIISFLPILAPGIIGMIIGLKLLDEKDENVLEVIAITPLRKSGYIAYRTLSSAIISFVITLLVIPFVGLGNVNFVAIIPVVLMACIETPIMALLLAAIAKNKVEGLAIAKFTGVLFMTPFVVEFIKSDWQYAFGVLPTYWVAKSFFESYNIGLGYWISLAVGFAVHLIILWLLVRRFNRVE